MNAKIQELTDKIYQEGVEKGKVDAAKIISDAKLQEKNLIDTAQKTAQQIISDAEKEAQILQKKTESELKVFTRQMVDALKIEITDLLVGKLTSESVKAATADKEFMQKVILTLAKEWAKSQELTIGAEDATSLLHYFEKNAKNLLDKGVSIEEVNNIKTSFQIVSNKEGYKIEVGDEEFVAYFKEFLRPKLLEILF